jgi:hypothetical protein
MSSFSENADIHGEVRYPSDRRWPKLTRAKRLDDYNVSLVRVSRIRDLLKGFDKTAMGAGTREGELRDLNQGPFDTRSDG